MANDQNSPGDAAKDAAGAAKDALGKLAGGATDKAGDLAGGAAGKAGDLAGGVTGKAAAGAAGITGGAGKAAKSMSGNIAKPNVSAPDLDATLPGRPTMNGGGRASGKGVWIDKTKSGKRPLSSAAKTGLGALTIGALGLGSVLWGVDHIEDDLEDAVIAEVQKEYGVTLSKDQVDFDGRSGEIVDMDLPVGVSTDDVERLLDGRIERDTSSIKEGDIRDIKVSGTEVAPEEPPPPPPPPETTVAPEPVVETGPIDVSVSTDGESITLDGEVLNQSQHDALVSAAEAEVGAANVTNNLTITGVEEQEAGSDAKIADMAALFAGFDGLTEGSGTVTDSALNFSGVAKDADGEAAIEGLAGSANAATSVDVSVAEVTVEQEVDLLQAELDALQAEILENVVFDVNSDVITPTAAGTLDKVVAAMTRYQRPVVLVGGHTDSDGNDALNLDLSDRRAKSVSQYLIDQGIAAERLVGTGFGETEPVAPNDTPENKQANRRVAFTAQSEFAS